MIIGQVTLPLTIDLPAYITQAIIDMSPYVATVAGCFFIFLVTLKAFVWAADYYDDGPKTIVSRREAWENMKGYRSGYDPDMERFSTKEAYLEYLRNKEE